MQGNALIAGQTGRLVLAVTLALTLARSASPVSGAELPLDGELLRLCVDHPALARGDDDAVVAELLERLPTWAESPLAELVAERVYSLESGLREPDRIVDALESVSRTSSLPAVAQELLAASLRHQLQRLGRREEAAAAEAALGYLSRFWTIGPFGKERFQDIEKPFPPERSIDVAASYPAGFQTLTWRFASKDPDGRWVAPLAECWPQRGVGYQLFQVNSNEERDAALWLASRGRSRVWLNGVLVIDDARERVLDLRRRARVRLAKGWNRVLVRSSASYWTRFTDLKDAPIPSPSLTECTEATLHPASPALEPEATELPPRAADVLSAALATLASKATESASPARDDDAQDDDAQDDGAQDEDAQDEDAQDEDAQDDDAQDDDAQDEDAQDEDAQDEDAQDEDAQDDDAQTRTLAARAAAGLALLRNAEGREELAVAACEQALSLDAGSAAIQHLCGDLIRGASYLPATQSKSRAQALWEAASKSGHLPSEIRLADLLHADRKSDQAARRVEALVEEHGPSLSALSSLRSYYSRLGWTTEERRTLRALRELAPSLPTTYAADAEYYGRHENSRLAETYLREAWRRDQRNTRWLAQLARMALSRNARHEAEGLLARYLALEPRSRDAMRSLADFWVGSGDGERALALLEAARDERPWAPWVHRDLAEIHEALGDTERARESRAMALSLSPGSLDLVRRRAAEDPDARPFWADHDERLEDWMDRIPGSGPMVENASAVVVIDVSVVEYHADGSSSEYIHQAQKLLTEREKDNLANVQIPGEVISLRTVLPDGTELEPVAALSGGQYVMPGLVPGAITEFAYRVDNSGNDGADVSHSRFYFQDFQYRQSYVLSRQVYLLPPGFPSDVVEHAMRPDSRGVGLAQVDRTERERPDGGRVIVYETRDSRRLQPEPSMPGYDDYLPNVEIRPRLSWDDVDAARREAQRRWTRPTPELERVALEVTAGIESPLEKARKLYTHVHDVVTQPGSGDAVSTLLERSGDRASLFMALLELSGVPANWAWLRPSEAASGPERWDRPEYSTFGYRAICLDLPGAEPQWITLDYRFAPFAKLPETLSGGRALVLEETGARVVTLPTLPATEYESYIGGELRIVDEQSVDVRLVVRTTGMSGYLIKERFSQAPAFQRDLVGRQIATRMFPGARVKSASLGDLDARGVPFEATLEVTAPKLLARSGERHAISGLVQPLGLVRGFGAAAKREHPFRIGSARAQRDELRIDPGPGFEIDESPRSVFAVHALGSYTLRYIPDGRAVRVERTLHLEPGEIAPEDYPAFVSFLESVDAAETERLILRRVETPTSDAPTVPTQD